MVYRSQQDRDQSAVDTTLETGAQEWEINATIIVSGVVAVACVVGLLALITL